MDRRVKEAAEILGIKELLQRKPASFQVVNASGLPWDGQLYASQGFSL